MKKKIDNVMISDFLTRFFFGDKLAMLFAYVLMKILI